MITALNLKKYILPIIGLVFLGFLIIFFLMRDIESPQSRCLAELGENNEKLIIDEFSDLFSSASSEKEAEFTQLRDSLRDYFDCRLVYASSHFAAEEIWNLVQKISLPESMKIQLLKKDSLYYNRYQYWTFRHSSIFFPAEYLCPADKISPELFKKCLDLPVALGLAERFDSSEVFDSCSDFCRDFARYSQDPKLFFEEEAQFEDLPSYKMSTALKVFWAIRFGGWEEGLRVMKKVQDSSGRERAEEIINSGREETERVLGAGNKECLQKFQELKEFICKFKLIR